MCDSCVLGALGFISPLMGVRSLFFWVCVLNVDEVNGCNHSIRSPCHDNTLYVTD